MEKQNTVEWIDVTVPVASDTPVWNGDAAPVITAIARHEDGDGMHLSEVFFGLHSGTHVDAPLHFLPGGGDVGSIPIGALIGIVRVLDATACNPITADWLLGKTSEEDRLIFKTIPDDVDRRAFMENPDFPALDAGAALLLIEQGIVLAGIDGLSIAIQSQLTPVHVTLLDKRVVIIEHLDLRGINEGLYEMIALPLRIAGAEAAPARVLLRPVPQ